jgi:hypothetical protein
MEKVGAPKKKLPVFRNPLFPIPNSSPNASCLGARKPITIAIPFDLPRKKGAVMQKENVSYGVKKVNTIM